MSCENCKTTSSADSVPFIVHESAMARAERNAKRLWIVILVLVGLLLATNVAWMIYESQFETVEETTTTQEVQQETSGGDNSFIGGDIYGYTESADGDKDIEIPQT